MKNYPKGGYFDRREQSVGRFPLGPCNLTAEEIANEEYPTFSILCKCGSKRVVIKSEVGASPESGMWGDITLICVDCGNKVIIFDALD